jgi:hypothetical protein
MAVAPRGGVAGRLVEQDRLRGDGVHKASAHADIIVLSDPGGEIAADGAVDRDAPLEDVLLAGATGTEACRSQKTIQAQPRGSGSAPGCGRIRWGTA